MSTTLSALTITVTTNNPTGSNSFTDAVTIANLSAGNEIDFSTPSPYEITLTASIDFTQSFIIFGDNDGNGISISPLSLSSGQMANLSPTVTTTLNNTSAEMEFNLNIVSDQTSALTKTGTGTCIIGGDNSGFYGQFNLSQGQITLASNTGLGSQVCIMDDGTTLSITGAFNCTTDVNFTGTATILASGGEVTLSGNTSGPLATLMKTGAGGLVLSGDNAHGQTYLSDGSIVLASSTGLGTGTFSMVNGTELQIFDGVSIANPINLSGTSNIYVDAGTGAIAGATASTSGLLKKIYGGTLVLSGNNRHTGGTTIDEGQITLANNNGLGTGRLTIENGSTLAINSDINASNPWTISDSATATINVSTGTGILSGHAENTTGALIKTGSGNLLLAGTNLYTGGTAINTGQITLGNNSAIGTSSLTMNNSTSLSILNGVLCPNTVTMTGASGSIVVNSGTGSLSGTITGASGVTSKSGRGNFTLASSGNFTGNVNVTEGIFTVNGLLAGDVLVEMGGTVKGTGTVQDVLTVQSGGTVAPGNSTGTITVGTLDLLAGSVTNIELNPSGSSAINVSNTANIAGSVHLTQDSGLYSNSTTYQILSAGSVSGVFDPVVTGGFPNFNFTIEYVGNTVRLSYELFIHTDGLSGNLLKFADYLNAYAPLSQEYDALASLIGEALARGINSASPARNVFGTFVAAQTMFSFSNILNGVLCDKRLLSSRATSENSTGILHFSELDFVASNGNFHARNNAQNNCEPLYELWVNGFGDVARQDGESQNAAFDFYTLGLLVGFDFSNVQEALFGGALGYANSQITTDGNMGSANINYGVASLYGYYLWENVYVEGTVWGGYNQVKNHRTIAYPSVETVAFSTIDNWQLAPHLEVGGLLIHKGRTIEPYLEPYIGVDYAVNWQGAYDETGAGNLNMRVKGQTSSMVQTEVGMRCYQAVEKSYARFGFKEGVSYINRTPFDTGSITAAIFGVSEFVTLTSFKTAQNLGAVMAELLIQPTKSRNFTISVGYQGQFGSQYILNEVGLRLSGNF